MSKHETASGKPPVESIGSPVPNKDKRPDGQHVDHWVLSEEDRAKGFVRPVRRSYVHLKCGVATSMPYAIAETYAAKPDYYGSTFCCGCKAYFPVGKDGEFVWNTEENEKVGT